MNRCNKYLQLVKTVITSLLHTPQCLATWLLLEVARIFIKVKKEENNAMNIENKNSLLETLSAFSGSALLPEKEVQTKENGARGI